MGVFGQRAYGFGSARSLPHLVAGASALVSMWLAGGCSRAAAPQGSPERAIVVDVVDGDTVVLDFGTSTERVRLLGVDAPESVHPTVPVQCFGPEAATGLSDLLPVGAAVEPRRDQASRDRYGRLLLHLFRADDGLHVNRWLVEQGLADTVTYPPNTALASQLNDARRQAMDKGIGLWGACDGPDQPLDPSAVRAD